MKSNGTHRPSFSPLSTFRPWRMRDGRRGSVTTAWPSAASVGASTIASTSASANVSTGRSPSATSVPARIVSGSPIPSSRAGTSTSLRSAPQVDPRRVGEEHEREGRLHDRADDRRSSGSVPASRRQRCRAQGRRRRTPSAPSRSCGRGGARRRRSRAASAPRSRAPSYASRATRKPRFPPAASLTRLACRSSLGRICRPRLRGLMPVRPGRLGSFSRARGSASSWPRTPRS